MPLIHRALNRSKIHGFTLLLLEVINMSVSDLECLHIRVTQ